MMELLNNDKPSTIKFFFIAGLLLFAVGMLFGITGALQYAIPGFLKQKLSFEKVRPLHVSSVIFWIIFGAIGAVFTYLQEYTGKRIFSKTLVNLQFLLFTVTVTAILISYLAGIFGGREYWEFHPVLAIPLATGWVLFIINFIKSVGSFKNQPVYVWMWITGLVFFLFTFMESYLWIIPYFRSNVVNDMTIQWKSYGSMVGSWNMLIYGSSIFLMEKISGNKKYSYSPMAFVLYFTGLFNLMFNWGHHIYTLPTYSFIKHISYTVSMTELFILGRIIYKWKDTVTDTRKHFHFIAYRFLLAADVWVFLSLVLAIGMSIPGINIYTHGTFVTVAHTMGATIGINSFLLLAVSFDVLYKSCRPIKLNERNFNRAYWLANFSLFIFWVSLIAAGIIKAKWQMSADNIPFSAMMLQLKPYFLEFLISGLALSACLLVIIYPLLKNQFVCILTGWIGKKKEKKSRIPAFSLWTDRKSVV